MPDKPIREIKFRLRDRHNKIVGYEKWFPGSWRYDNPDAGLAEGSGWWQASPCWLYSTDGVEWHPPCIDHCRKDQFTGLKDKAGREIYEGDICKSYIYTMSVEYGEFCTGPSSESCGIGFFMTPGSVYPHENLYYANTDVEIIGNIYENSELLEVSGG